MAANHFHFVQRNASLGFHAQVFATVVEHATVNLFICSYINILFLGRVDFSN